jgi:hypothetical protein
MNDSTHPMRPPRSARPPAARGAAAVLATAVLGGVLAAGCGGGSQGVASGTSSATATQNGALGFARCMRSHGVSKWPDPTSSGVFDKSKLQHLGVSRSRLTSISHTCNRLYPSDGAPQGYTITPADQADYLRGAACMRAHGFRGFPDPTFRDNNVTLNIPSSIDTHTFAFKTAAATCTKLIPAGLPYSR